MGGTSGSFDKKAEQWFGMFFLGAAGAALGVLGFLSGLIHLNKIPLAILLGVLFGYLFAGQWVVVAYCSRVPYYQCLCNDPDGPAKTKTCPNSYLEGSIGGTYLAAADASELIDINGAMTVLCGNHPTDLTFDPYVGMVDKVGERGTHDYVKALYDQSRQWID